MKMVAVDQKLNMTEEQRQDYNCLLSKEISAAKAPTL
jgi:hypothetical protein